MVQTAFDILLVNTEKRNHQVQILFNNCYFPGYGNLFIILFKNKELLMKLVATWRKFIVRIKNIVTVVY